MQIVSVEQMKELERQANDGGLSYDRMMVKAGNGLAETVHNHFFKGNAYCFGVGRQRQ